MSHCRWCLLELRIFLIWVAFLGLVFRLFNSRPLWGIDTRYLEWGLALDQVLRLATVLRPVQAGPCTTEVLLMSMRVEWLLSNVQSCRVGLTRPIASKCHHEGVLLLPTRLASARRVSSQEKMSDAQIRRSPLNFLLNKSSGSASVFHMGLKSAWWVVA